MTLIVCFLLATLGNTVFALSNIQHNYADSSLNFTKHKRNSFSNQTLLEDIRTLLISESDSEEDDETLEKRFKIIARVATFLYQTVQLQYNATHTSSSDAHIGQFQSPIYIRFCALKIPS